MNKVAGRLENILIAAGIAFGAYYWAAPML